MLLVLAWIYLIMGIFNLGTNVALFGEEKEKKHTVALI